jgi:hypothetical protein
MAMAVRDQTSEADPATRLFLLSEYDEPFREFVFEAIHALA